MFTLTCEHATLAFPGGDGGGGGGVGGVLSPLHGIHLHVHRQATGVAMGSLPRPEPQKRSVGAEAGTGSRGGLPSKRPLSRETVRHQTMCSCAQRKAASLAAERLAAGHLLPCNKHPRGREPQALTQSRPAGCGAFPGWAPDRCPWVMREAWLARGVVPGDSSLPHGLSSSNRPLWAHSPDARPAGPEPSMTS